MMTLLALPLALLGEDLPAVDAALTRMKATGRWGVILIVPEKERFRLGQRLWAMTAFEEDLEAHEILSQAVFTALTPELARPRFGEIDATRLLLSPEGRLLASDRPSWDVYATAAAFTASFRPFLHGDKGERLEERARAQEATLTPEMREAVEKLGSDSLDERLSARGLLSKEMDKLTVWAAWMALQGPEKSRHSARLLLSTYYTALPSNAPGAKVLYGCRGPEYPRYPCHARIPERERMFLRILTGDPKLDNPPKRGED